MRIRGLAALIALPTVSLRGTIAAQAVSPQLSPTAQRAATHTPKLANFSKYTATDSLSLMKCYTSVVVIFAVLVACSLSCCVRAASSGTWAGSAETSISIPLFPYSQGWLGADDAYSIPLAPGKSVWLFGDTFVGSPKTTLRSKATTMIHNSVGISTCGPGKKCTMQYFWRNRETAKPRSFFDTGQDDVWYWPLDGYLHDKALYISFLIVFNRPGAQLGDAFGFVIGGTKWAKVTNLADPPERWKISFRDMTHADLWPGVSLIPDGNFLLLYTQVSEGEGKGYMTVLRVPREKLEDPPASWEYLARDGEWHPGTPHGDAMNVIDQPISEMSVRYHPAQKEWVAISPGPEFPSPHIVARIADSPIGPWSKPKTIFTFPEMRPSTPGYDKDTFCYATKEHVEFETDFRMVLTYACYSFSTPKAKENMSIYRPQVVVVDVPN